MPIDDKNVVVYFNFLLAQSKKIHSREVFTLLEMLGEIGGTYEILMISIALLVGSFPERHFIVSLMNRLEGSNPSKTEIYK